MSEKSSESFLPARAVKLRYGVSDMSLWRWLRDQRLGFPAPIIINRHRFWRESDLVAWERQRAAGQSCQNASSAPDPGLRQTEGR